MFVKQLFTSNPASFYWGYSQYSCLYFPITHLSSHPEEMESAHNNGQIGGAICSHRRTEIRMYGDIIRRITI